jgi:hypothetical protein
MNFISNSASIKIGQRLIVVHGGGCTGFVPGALLVWKATLSTCDYHNEMNGENFQIWLCSCFFHGSHRFFSGIGTQIYDFISFDNNFPTTSGTFPFEAKLFYNVVQ